MKLVIFADAHVGQYKEFDIDGSRLDRCINAVDQVLTHARDVQADLVIDAGDLLDRKNLIDFRTYNKLYRLLQKHGSSPEWLYSVVGNHNMANYDGSENNLEPLSELMTVVDEPHVLWSNAGPIGFMPFRRRIDQWVQDFNRLCAEVKGHRAPLCVGHQEIKGAVTGTHRYVASDGIDPATMPGPWQYVVFGHYHKYQQLAANVFYLGALLQQDFGEEGNPQIFWEVDITGKNVNWTAKIIQSSCFYTIEDVETIPDAPRDFYRLRAEVDNPNDIQLEPEQRRVVRVETCASQENLQRLNPASYGSIEDLIESYIALKVPEHLQAAVRSIYHQMRNG